MKKSDPLELQIKKDRAFVAESFKWSRILQGYSQVEVAKRSGLGVSTIYQIETGKPVRLSSMRKLCEVLGDELEDIVYRRVTFQSDTVRTLLHTSDRDTWLAPIDARPSVPSDKTSRFKDPAERQRLGSQGFIPAFFSFPTFILTRGPGLTKIELYRRYPHTINEAYYRQGTLYCISGSCVARISGTDSRIEAGDILAFDSSSLEYIEPSEDHPPLEPVQLIWIGGDRASPIDTKLP